MQQRKKSNLYDKYASRDFYEERYAHSYIDEWPLEKKQIILEVIRSLQLPEIGEALDFGCGNGVLTNIIKQALPGGWKVSGTDISKIAIENAKKRYPECIFVVADDKGFIGKKFDFLFTHHVLEHVYNLSQVLAEIEDLLKNEAIILHILPCGNPGSFEHGICLLRKDGIDSKRENRFFFEDEGHLRRLSTEQLSNLYREKEVNLVKEYYANQYYGAINWITMSGPGFIRLFTDISAAADEKAKSKLKRLRYKLFFLWFLRYPASFVGRRLMRNRSEKFLVVAQAFQPVRITEAGETPSLPPFHYLWVGQRPMSNCPLLCGWREAATPWLTSLQLTRLKETILSVDFRRTCLYGEGNQGRQLLGG